MMTASFKTFLPWGLLAFFGVIASAQGHHHYKEKQFSQNFYDSYNVLKYTGAIGPYTDRESYGINRDTPDGCAVDQVIMLMRHGERYPDAVTSQSFTAVLAKLDAASTSWSGDLAFLNNWEHFIPDQGLVNQESFSGPYSGLLDAMKRGSQYRSRYGHLWDGESIIPIFAGGYQRVIETARFFGMGFFGYNYSTHAAVNIISEDPSQGANTLTPVCPKAQPFPTCYFIPRILPEFAVATARLNRQTPGLALNSSDIATLMSMAAYELQVRPYSPWANAFRLDEWVAFGHMQNLIYWDCAGPGDPLQLAVGQVFANASLTLLQQGPAGAKMSWNFAHDVWMTPVIAALGLDTPSNPISNKTIPFPAKWKVSNIVPMGGHFIFERLSCNSTAVGKAGTFVRIVINEAVVPIEDCQNGPGYSCSLANYAAIIQKIPSFADNCLVNSTDPKYLDFWWNYNTTTDLNYRNGTIPYQATLVYT